MQLIEPCCAKRHLLNLRNAIRNGGTAGFEGYGDLSLTELLPALLTRYTETDMILVAPMLPDQAAEVVDLWMRRQWARMDGKGKLDVIARLTVVARLDKSSHHIASWLKDRPFGDRLTLIDMQQEDTAILLPDFAITGPVNMRYGRRFTAEATTVPERVSALWERYGRLAEEHAKDKAAETVAGTEAAPEKPARKKSSRKRKKA